MSALDKLLAAEEDVYRREELILRQFAVHIRGLRGEHIEPIIALHLKDCSDYYLAHGTIDGPSTPWMTGNRRILYGKKEDN